MYSKSSKTSECRVFLPPRKILPVALLPRRSHPSSLKLRGVVGAGGEGRGLTFIPGGEPGVGFWASSPEARQRVGSKHRGHSKPGDNHKGGLHHSYLNPCPGDTCLVGPFRAKEEAF